MMDNWFYQYKVKVSWNEEATTLLSGIVPAHSLVGAAKLLEDYYGEDSLLEIQMLKPIIEGPVFEFNLVTGDDNFDYQITAKRKNSQKITNEEEKYGGQF